MTIPICMHLAYGKLITTKSGEFRESTENITDTNWIPFLSIKQLHPILYSL